MKAEAECFRPHGIKSSELRQLEQMLMNREAMRTEAKAAELQSRAEQKQ